MEGLPVDDQLVAARDAAEEDLLLSRPFISPIRERMFTFGLGRVRSTGLGPENVVGVGIATGEEAAPVVAVYVERKAPLEEVQKSAWVPASYEGVQTTVIESGRFVAASATDRHRPVPLGVSIGHLEGETGTSGFLARRGDQLFIVSNNHVLAKENQARRGDAIIQPGRYDLGGEGDRIAELSDWVDLNFGGESRVDAAIASVQEGEVRNEFFEGGRYDDTIASPVPRQAARKHGRTTGLTYGEVTDISASIRVAYQRGSVLLKDQIVVRGNGGPFARGGDSGSLILDDATDQPIALLCAVSPKDLAVGNKIDQVLKGLEVSWASDV